MGVGSGTTVSDGREQALVCEHDAMRSVSVVYRPSGPPDCVSIIPTVMSRILSRIFDCFGLIVADGNSW